MIEPKQRIGEVECGQVWQSRLAEELVTIERLWHETGSNQDMAIISACDAAEDYNGRGVVSCPLPWLQERFTLRARAAARVYDEAFASAYAAGRTALQAESDARYAVAHRMSEEVA